MGVTGLWKLIEGAGKEVSLESLEGKVFAVDASILLNQAIKGMKDQPNAHLHVLFLRICKLLTYQIKPIFVYDGSTPVLKKQTLAARQKNRDEAAAKALDVSEQLKLKKIQQLAIDKSIGKTSTTIVLPSDKSDIFALPPLPEIGLHVLNENNEDNDLDIHDILYAQDFDISQVDIRGAEFRGLPAEYQHEILEEVREYNKHHLPSNYTQSEELKSSHDFSNFQLSKLVKNNQLTQKIETLRKVMMGSMSDQQSSSSQSITAQKIASEDQTHSLLIKKIPNPIQPITKPETDQSDAATSKHYHIVPETKKTPVFFRDRKRKVQDNIRLDDPMLSSDEEQELEISKKKTSLEIFEETPSTSQSQQTPNNAPSTLNNAPSTHETIDYEETILSSPEVVEFSENISRQSMVPERVEEDLTILDNSSQLVVGSEHDQLIKAIPAHENDISDSDKGKQLSNEVTQYSNETKLPIINSEAISHKEVEVRSSADEREGFDGKNYIEQGQTTTESEELDAAVSAQVKQTAPIQVGVSNDDEIIHTKEVGMSSGVKTSREKTNPILEEILALKQKFRKDSEDIEIVFEVEKKEPPTPNIHEVDENQSPDRPDVAAHIDERGLEMSPPPSDFIFNSEAEILEFDRDLNLETRGLNQEFRRQDAISSLVTKQMIDDSLELLRLFGVPYVVSPSEAEAQCATLNQLGLCDGIITDDSDVWLFGGIVILKNFFQMDRHVLSYKLKDVEALFGLDRRKLIAIALVSGSDYTNGIPGGGPVTAMEIISEFDRQDGLSAMSKFSEFISVVKANNNMLPASDRNNVMRTKLSKVLSLPEAFPNPVIIDAYLKPAVDESTETFEWGKPDLDLLRKYARSKLGWPTKKVDDLVQPVLKRINSPNKQTTLDKYMSIRPTSIIASRELQSKRVKAAVSKILSSTEPQASNGSLAPISNRTSSTSLNVNPHNNKIPKMTKAAAKPKRSQATKNKNVKSNPKQPVKVSRQIISHVNLSDESDSN